MIPTLTFERSLREDKIAFEKLAIARVESSGGGAGPDADGPLIMTMDRTCRRIWSMSKHIRVLHHPDCFAPGERLLALVHLPAQAVFASFVGQGRGPRGQQQTPPVTSGDIDNASFVSSSASETMSHGNNTTRVTFWDHKLECMGEVALGDQRYSSVAHNPATNEILLVGNAGLAVYRVQSEARKDAGAPCCFKALQSVRADIGNSKDNVTSVRYLSPDSFAVATATSLRVFVKALPRSSVGTKKTWLRTDIKPPVYVPLEYTECALADSSAGVCRGGASIVDIEVTTSAGFIVVIVGYSDGFISIFSSSWLFKALQLVADAGRRGLHPDDVSRAPSMRLVASFRAFRVPVPASSSKSIPFVPAATSMSLKVHSGSSLTSAMMAFSVVAMDGNGMICHYEIPLATLRGSDAVDSAFEEGHAPHLGGVHNMGFDKNREFFNSEETQRRLYSGWEPSANPRDATRDDPLLAIIPLSHERASLLASIGGQMCFLNINELQSEVTHCFPPPDAQSPPSYALIPDDLHRFDSALAFESTMISDDDERTVHAEDDRIVLVAEQRTNMLNWVNTITEKILRTINLGNILLHAHSHRPVSYGKVSSLDDLGALSFCLFSTSTRTFIAGFSTGSICVIPMAMLGRGRSAAQASYVRFNTKAVHSSPIRKMIVCPQLDGSGDVLISGDDKGVVASWKINKNLDASVLEHAWAEGPHMGWIVHLELFTVPLRPDAAKSAELQRIQSANGKTTKLRESLIVTACSGGIIKAWKLSFLSGKLSLLASLNVGSKPAVISMSAITFLMGEVANDAEETYPKADAGASNIMPEELKVSQDFSIACLCGRSNGVMDSFILSNNKLSASANCKPASILDLHLQSITAQAVMPSVSNTQAFKVGSGNVYLASSNVSLVIASEDSISLIHVDSQGHIQLDGYQSICIPHSLSNRKVRSVVPQVVRSETENDSYVNCIVVRDEVVTKHVVNSRSNSFPAEWGTMTTAFYEKFLLGATMRDMRSNTPSSAARSRRSTRPGTRAGTSSGRVPTSGGFTLSRPQSPTIIELRPSLQQSEEERIEIPVVQQEVFYGDYPVGLESYSSREFSFVADDVAYYAGKTFFPSHSSRATAPFGEIKKSGDIDRVLIANLFSVKKDQFLVEMYKKACIENLISNPTLIPCEVAVEIMHVYSKFSREEIMNVVHMLGIDASKGISFIQVCKVLATLRFVSQQSLSSTNTSKKKKYREMRASKPVVVYNSMGERVVQRDKSIHLEPKISDGIVNGVFTHVRKMWDSKASKIFSLMEDDFNEKGFFTDIFPAIVDQIPVSFQGILKSNRVTLPTVWMPDAANYVELGRAIKIARALFDRRLGLQRDFVLAISPNSFVNPSSDLSNGLPTMAELIVQYFERNYGGPELNVSHTKVAFFIEALFQYSRYPVIDALRKFACPEESGVVNKEASLWFYIEARDFLYSRNCVQKSSDLVAVYLEGSLTVSESISVESSTSVGFNQWERIPRREAALCVVEMLQRRGAFGCMAVDKALKMIEKLPSLNAGHILDMGGLQSDSVGRLDFEYSTGSADEEWIDLESFLDVLTTFINTLIFDIENANSRLFHSDNATRNRRIVSSAEGDPSSSAHEISKTFDNLKQLTCSLLYYDKTRLGLVSVPNFEAVISREGDVVLGLVDTEHRSKFLHECRRLFFEGGSQGIGYIDVLGVLLSAAMQGFGSGLIRGEEATQALSRCTRGLEDNFANILIFLLGHYPSPNRLHTPLWTIGSSAIQSIVDGTATTDTFDWKKGMFALNLDGKWMTNAKATSEEPGLLSITKIDPTPHLAAGIGEVGLGVDGSEWRNEALKIDSQIISDPTVMLSSKRSEVEAAPRDHVPVVAAVGQSLTDSESPIALFALPVTEQYALSTVRREAILFDIDDRSFGFPEEHDSPHSTARRTAKAPSAIVVTASSVEEGSHLMGLSPVASVANNSHENVDALPHHGVAHGDARLAHYSPKRTRSIFNYLEDDMHDKAFYSEEVQLRNMRVPVIDRILRSRGKQLQDHSPLESMTNSLSSINDSASAAADGNRSVAVSEYHKVLDEEEDAAVEMARERERMKRLLGLRTATAEREKALAIQREKEMRKKMALDGQNKAKLKAQSTKLMMNQMRSSSSSSKLEVAKKPSVAPAPKAQVPTKPATPSSAGLPKPKSRVEDRRIEDSLVASVGSRKSQPSIADGSHDNGSEGSLESADELSEPSIPVPISLEASVEMSAETRNSNNTPVGRSDLSPKNDESSRLQIKTPDMLRVESPMKGDRGVSEIQSPTASMNSPQSQTPNLPSTPVKTPKPPSSDGKVKTPSRVDPRIDAMNQRKIEAKQELDNIKQMKANDINVLTLTNDASGTSKFALLSANFLTAESKLVVREGGAAEPTTVLGRKINRFLEVMKKASQGTNLHPRRYDDDSDGRKFFMPQMFADDIRFDPVSAPAYESGWFHEQLEEDREIRDRLRLEPSKDFSDLTRLINFKKDRNRVTDDLVVEERDLRPAEYTTMLRTNRVDWNAFMEREKAEAAKNAETDTNGTSASRRSTFTSEHAFAINKKSRLPHVSILGHQVYMLPLGYVASERLRKDHYIYYQIDVPRHGTILTINLKCHMGSAAAYVLWNDEDLPSSTHFHDTAQCTEMNSFEAQMASHAPPLRKEESATVDIFDEDSTQVSRSESSRRAILAVLSHEECTDFTLWAISSSGSTYSSKPIANVTKLVKELNLLASRDLKDLTDHFPICRREARKQVIQESADEENGMTSTIKKIVAKSVQDSIAQRNDQTSVLANEIIRSVNDDETETMERFVTRAGTMAVARAMRTTFLAPGNSNAVGGGESAPSAGGPSASVTESVRSNQESIHDHQNTKKLKEAEDCYHENADEIPMHIAKLERLLSHRSEGNAMSKSASSSDLVHFPMLHRHPTLKDMARTSAEGLETLRKKPKPIQKNLNFVPTPITYKLTLDGMQRTTKK